MENDQRTPPTTPEHLLAHRPALAPRLHARLDVLIGRLQATHLAADQRQALATTLHDVISRIEVAEQSVNAHDWIHALRAAQNCEPALSALVAEAHRQDARKPRHVSTAAAVEGLWAWLIAQAELYCRLQITHRGLALRDPEDTDDDDDVEHFDFTGHIGEELVRQARQAEETVQRLWRTDRYRMYRTIYTNFSRLRTYTAGRGWIEETDALDYMMQRARMRGLQYYVWERDLRREPGHLSGWRRIFQSDRGAVLGRLLLDRFYWLVAGFGYRPLRAVLVNSLVVLVFAYLFWQFRLLCVYSTGGAETQVGQCQPVGFVQSLYFSALAFFLAAMGEIIPRPLWGQALLVLESIWGFLNMSVVIAVILNRQRGD